MIFNAASAFVLASMLTSFASASPLVPRYNVNQAQGYLHVLELEPGNPTPLYNKTASFQRDHLQIADPNYSFTLVSVCLYACKVARC
jgi:hypothetical protein